jgi:hypothetical protein
MPIDRAAIKWDEPAIDLKAVQWDDAPKESTYGDRLKANTKVLAEDVKNAGAGLLRGAGSIGATALAPVDYLTRQAQKAGLAPDWSIFGRDDRRQGMTNALGTLGADTASVPFKAGKLGGEIAGTAGAGGALGNLASRAGAMPEIANALASGGFATGSSRLGAAGNLAVRSGAGAAAGGATVGLVSPEDAGMGAAIGGALPGALKVAGGAASLVGDVGQWGAKKLMQSALKPTIEQRRSGEAKTAVDTLLKYGISPTNGGIEKLKMLIGDLNDEVSNALAASNATIDPKKVTGALAGTRAGKGYQVSPTSDLQAVQGVEDDFMSTWGAGEIPVQIAQKVKQGTYRTLKGKYGEQGSASTEAQKALARGLKDEIAEAVPAVVPLNAEESRLLATLTVAERRALLEGNKDPIGLGAVFALAAGQPGVALGSIVNSTAGTKAALARALNKLSSLPPERLNALAGPAAYRSLPRAEGLDTGHR